MGPGDMSTRRTNADSRREEAQAAWASRYGAGSRRELGDRLARALEAAGDADHAVVRARVEREHQAAYGAASLAAEAADERARDAAVTDDAALVAYEQKWSRSLARLQRSHPGRWRLPGLSDDELRDELTLRLIEAVRTRHEERARHQRAGKEWGLLFLEHQRRQLRQAFRLKIVHGEISSVPERALDEEQSLLARESATVVGLARERGERSLTRPQRRWLAAMRLTADAGAFFAASGKLNLAAVSRRLEKNRSSANRAFEELRRHFTRELRRLEG
jgi:hypothetical protein